MKHVFISNIRSIQELEVEIESPITIIAGMNGTGKTTVLEAIERSLMLKGFDKSAIQNGKEAGQVVYVNQTNGDKQQVTMNIGKDSTVVTMTVSDTTGKVRTIREVGEARKMLGNYVNFTPQDLVNMTQTAEGRRKFLMEVLFKSLPNETKARLLLLENKVSPKRNKDTQDNLYAQRSAVQAEILSYEKTLNTLPKINEEQQEIIDNLENAKIRKAEIQTELENERLQKELIEDVKSYLNTKKERLQHSPAWFDSLLDLVKKIEPDVVKYNDLKERLIKAEQYISDAQTYISAKATSTNILASLMKKRDEYGKLDSEIKTHKAEISEIYKQAELPGDITIEEDENGDIDFIVSNGKALVSISQLSESQLHFIIITLLMHISTAEMINIGNIDVYDKNTLQKILDLAKKYDRILLAERVTESEDLQVEII